MLFNTIPLIESMPVLTPPKLCILLEIMNSALCGKPQLKKEIQPRITRITLIIKE